MPIQRVRRLPLFTATLDYRINTSLAPSSASTNSTVAPSLAPSVALSTYSTRKSYQDLQEELDLNKDLLALRCDEVFDLRQKLEDLRLQHAKEVESLTTDDAEVGDPQGAQVAMQNLLSEINEKTTLVSDHEQHIQEMTGHIAGLHEQIAGLKEQAEDMSMTIDSKNIELDTYETRVTELREKLDKAEADAASKSEQAHVNDGAFMHMLKKVNSQDDEIDSQHNVVKELQEKIEDLETEIAELKSTNIYLEDETEFQGKCNADLQAQIQENQEKIAALQSELTSQQATQSNMYNFEECMSAYKLDAKEVDQASKNEKQQLIQENGALASKLADEKAAHLETKAQVATDQQKNEQSIADLQATLSETQKRADQNLLDQKHYRRSYKSESAAKDAEIKALKSELEAAKKAAEKDEILHADEIAKLKLVKRNRELWMETEVTKRTDELQGELDESNSNLLSRDARILALERENAELKAQTAQAELEAAVAIPVPLSRTSSPRIMSPTVCVEEPMEDEIDSFLEELKGLQAYESS
ncbi:hypothetical protein K491DRAFT_778469 [Lophiostoma macrostomum CBS 122681]|uniref:Uncharacterized protein n=1 Tax=Lophiostoma macrostomum CBS 122681 TaxID=1314788 RepID=A0A6A6TB08_9PLEO|nr:hypothetical protein K491DRAFT_778469 [Lophiostoma macrostomum CBS 122681]